MIAFGKVVGFVAMLPETCERSVVLVAVLFLLGCTQSDTPSAPPVSATHPNHACPMDDELIVPEELLVDATDDPTTEYHGVLPDDVLYGPEELRLVECEEHEAETVLAIRVIVPGVRYKYHFDIPLCRRKIRPLEFSFRSRCICADGFDGGYNSSVGVLAATQTSVTVSLHLSWHMVDGPRGSIDEELPVTIGTPSMKKLDGDIEVQWKFREPSPDIDPPKR